MVCVDYNIGGRVINHVIVAFKGVYLNLLDKISPKTGASVVNYGLTRINVYIPFPVIKQFMGMLYKLLGNNIKTDAQLNESNVSTSTGLDREMQTDRFM